MIGQRRGRDDDRPGYHVIDPAHLVGSGHAVEVDLTAVGRDLDTLRATVLRELRALAGDRVVARTTWRVSALDQVTSASGETAVIRWEADVHAVIVFGTEEAHEHGHSGVVVVRTETPGDHV